jgi:hypothetical protein
MRTSYRRFLAAPLTVHLLDGSEIEGYLKEDIKGVLVLYGDDNTPDVLIAHDRINFIVKRQV